MTGHRGRLIVLGVVGIVSVALAIGVTVHRRDPVVSWAAHERLLMRTKADKTHARIAQVASQTKAAWKALTETSATTSSTTEKIRWRANRRSAHGAEEILQRRRSPSIRRVGFAWNDRHPDSLRRGAAQEARDFHRDGSRRKRDSRPQKAPKRRARRRDEITRCRRARRSSL